MLLQYELLPRARIMSSCSRGVDHCLSRDEWLSAVLDQDVYRLLADEKFIESAVSDRGRWKPPFDGKPVFIYTKVSTDFTNRVACLESLGFDLIDTCVTFDKQISEQTAPTPRNKHLVRFAVPEDKEQVVELARGNFRYSRFHLDPLISEESANRIKMEWVRNYFAGLRGDQMIVSLVGKEVAGFLLILYQSSARLVIDLIAVDERFRGRGLAKDMIAFAEHAYPSFSQLVVGTQVSNIPSLRLYEKMGFQICATQYVFHYHPRE